MSRTKEIHESKIQHSYNNSLCKQCKLFDWKVYSPISDQKLCRNCYELESENYYGTVKFYCDIALFSSFRSLENISVEENQVKDEENLKKIAKQLHSIPYVVFKTPNIAFSNQQFDKLIAFFISNGYPQLFPSKDKIIDLAIAFYSQNRIGSQEVRLKESIFYVLTNNDYTLKLSTTQKLLRMLLREFITKLEK